MGLYVTGIQTGYQTLIKYTMAITFIFQFLPLLILCAVEVEPLNVHWCPKQCDCYNQFSVVDCSARGLTTLPHFSNLTQRLYLEDNHISMLPIDGFANTPHLQVVTLHNNALRVVNTAVFCGLSILEEINLSGNGLHELFVSTECVAPLLHRIELQHNNLLQPPTNMSAFAPNLRKLNLSFNQLHSVLLDPSYSLMSQLMVLDMRANNIHEVYSGDLDAISESLKVLHLGDCGLVFLDDTALANMQNLTQLSLQRNFISSTNLEQVFSQLGNNSQLRILDLSGMYFPNITFSMLSQLKQLTNLDISDSSIVEIDPSLWSVLTQMEELSLHNNELNQLGNLTPMRQLRKLHLQHNHLKEVYVERLYNLDLLDLSYNDIEIIPASWMAGTDILFMLNISHNNIATISPHAFEAVNMHTLDLSFNKLSTLHSFGHIKLSKLHLQQNQITTVTPDAFHQLDVTLEDLDLSYNNLTSFFNYPFREFVSLQSLNLAHNKLGEALKKGGEMLGELFASLSHLQVLNLAYNEITSLQHQQLQHMHHLTTLYLHGNDIVDLLDLSLPDAKSLAKLVVSDNRLGTVEPAVLTSLEYLEVVDLSNNPYDCSCHLLHFLHWLNTTLVSVLYTDTRSRYQCANPYEEQGKYILDYRPNAEDCLQYDHLHLLQHKLTLVGLAVAMLFVLGLLVTIVLYYGHICQRIKSLQYRWQIRYREVSGVEIAGDPKA